MKLALGLCLAFLAGCAAGGWKTAGDVLDILAGPSPQEECEARGGTWTKQSTYNPRTGELERVTTVCVEVKK